jgi:hypothetical protein
MALTVRATRTNSDSLIEKVFFYKEVVVVTRIELSI